MIGSVRQDYRQYKKINAKRGEWADVCTVDLPEIVPCLAASLPYRRVRLGAERPTPTP